MLKICGEMLEACKAPIEYPQMDYQNSTPFKATKLNLILLGEMRPAGFVALAMFWFYVMFMLFCAGVFIGFC